ncbi:MAG: bile acid:sodium symporter family protein [Bacteroidota bacterium]
MEFLDQAQLTFSPESLVILNITLGFIMYGVALSLTLDDFKRVAKSPLSPAIGIFSQFILLPGLTYLLILLIKPIPSMALGMIMVAACPGGNISNFISLMAKGNVALSVSLTAISTLLSIIMTPFNFSFWANMYEPTAQLLKVISIDPMEMVVTIIIVLAIPLILGMWTAHKLPAFTKRISPVIRTLSIVIFGFYVVIAIYNNLDAFLNYIQYIILIVLAHNAVAFMGGFSMAKLFRRDEADTRSITIETGIQNSGLALVIIFNPNFFDGLGGMALIAALWGVWHIISGLTVASLWARLGK